MVLTYKRQIQTSVNSKYHIFQCIHIQWKHNFSLLTSRKRSRYLIINLWFADIYIFLKNTVNILYMSSLYTCPNIELVWNSWKRQRYMKVRVAYVKRGSVSLLMATSHFSLSSWSAVSYGKRGWGLASHFQCNVTHNSVCRCLVPSNFHYYPPFCLFYLPTLVTFSSRTQGLWIFFEKGVLSSFLIESVRLFSYLWKTRTVSVTFKVFTAVSSPVITGWTIKGLCGISSPLHSLFISLQIRNFV